MQSQPEKQLDFRRRLSFPELPGSLQLGRAPEESPVAGRCGVDAGRGPFPDEAVGHARRQENVTQNVPDLEVLTYDLRRERSRDVSDPPVPQEPKYPDLLLLDINHTLLPRYDCNFV